MEYLFLIIFLLSPVLLIVSLVNPNLFNFAIINPSRKKLTAIFVGATIVSFIGFGITAEEVSQDKKAITQKEEVQETKQLKNNNKKRQKKDLKKNKLAKTTTTKDKQENKEKKAVNTPTSTNKIVKKKADIDQNKAKEVKQEVEKKQEIIKGCTDKEAKNYNSKANESDGSCKFADKTHEVVRVVDGDTIVVNYNGKNEKVRLIGLDTTESKDPRKKVQCFSREASSKMMNLVSGKEVKLEQGPMSDNRGYYGRLLRYVYLPNGTHVNAWMVKNGYGYAYTKYPFSKQSQFESYEQQARDNKLGLWADGVCEKEEETQTTETNSSDYICSSNEYNCSDFDTYTEAKDVYEACGGVDNDVHRLDSDNDKKPCERLGY